MRHYPGDNPSSEAKNFIIDLNRLALHMNFIASGEIYSWLMMVAFSLNYV
jgi:hypothetical protein